VPSPQKGDLAIRTKDFALRILRVFPKLPRTTEAQILGKQLLRAATSVGANYREAYRGRSKPEFIAKCGDSLRELEETGYRLELLLEAKLAPQETITPLKQECDEVTAIFVTILKRSKENLP
jgi:four helix bundle protein